MAEDMTYEPVTTGFELAANRLAARVRELEAQLNAAIVGGAQLQKRVDELTLIIGVIDERMGPADNTCDEPGITVSEAAKRTLADAGMIDYRYSREAQP
jgi:hypothetical protein